MVSVSCRRSLPPIPVGYTPSAHSKDEAVSANVVSSAMNRLSHSASSLPLRSMGSGVAVSLVDRVQQALRSVACEVDRHQASVAAMAVLECLKRSAGNEVNRVCSKILADFREVRGEMWIAVMGRLRV